MSYLRYVCSFAIVMFNTCAVFSFCFSSSCVPYVASVSGLFIFLLLPRYSVKFI